MSEAAEVFPDTTEEFRYTPKQLQALDLLSSEAENIALGGGSRSGKTFILVLAVLTRALKAPKTRHAIFRFRFNSLKASVIYDTLPKVMDLRWPGLREKCEMNRTDWFLKLPNGSEIWFGGLDDSDRTEKILGQEFSTIYFNECSQIPWPSVVLALTRLAQRSESLQNRAYYDFNPPGKKHWTYRCFIERKNPETNKPWVNQSDYAYLLMNPTDNLANLSPSYLRRLENLPEKARKRFLLGQFADVSDGALWTEELLAATRHLGQVDKPLPEFLRVVIAVDPSGCQGPEDERSDEIGIVVGALGTDGHGYLLEDLSGRYGPEEWGSIVADAYGRHAADCVVVERNFGGAMVTAVLRAADPDIPIREVVASRGKVVRAEPISALYEQGKIHHVGHFPEIEEQLCAMTVSGYQGLRSPDRADSVVWLWTELFMALTRKQDPQERAPRVIKQARSASRLDRW